MNSIDQLILNNINPFDNYRSVGFWQKQSVLEPMVESIHQEVVTSIEETLSKVTQDRGTRTILLSGESGSGKTYLLGRLKQKLNTNAFFVYIPPFPQSNYIWRHILRYTVDSLIQVPERESHSQLLLWLKNILISMRQKSLKERIFKEDLFNLLRSDRKNFINKLKLTYRHLGVPSIYNADKFLGILHDLTKPELYTLACEWLQGEDLSEENLRILQVKKSIETEEEAREILGNFGKIAIDTKPIVLCFDQLESIARLSDGNLDLQTLFNVNTKIHNEDSNFLVMISILDNTWKQYENKIDQSHLARIDQKLVLKRINLQQAELLWKTRLATLHFQARPKPTSSIYPLDFQCLEIAFPGSKAQPREVLILGREIVLRYKEWLLGNKKQKFDPCPTHLIPTSNDNDLEAALCIKWLDEFTKVKQVISKIQQFSSPELIKMLQEILSIFELKNLQTSVLMNTKFSNYSLGYTLPENHKQISVIWTENANMGTLFYIMQACQKHLDNHPHVTLKLIRSQGLGNPKNKGYQSFQKIFISLSHSYIKPTLTAVHYLVTYYNLLKEANEGELVINGQQLGRKKLKNLIYQAKLLNQCSLLQDLEIIVISPQPMDQIQEIILNLLATQIVIGREALIDNIHRLKPNISLEEIDRVIQQLYETDKIKIPNPTAPKEHQSICWIPN